MQRRILPAALPKLFCRDGQRKFLERIGFHAEKIFNRADFYLCDFRAG